MDKETGNIISVDHPQKLISCEVDRSSAQMGIRFAKRGGCLGVSQRWFINEEEGKQEILRSKPYSLGTRKLPAAGISWSEKSKTNDLLFEYAIELQDDLCFCVRVSNRGKEARTLQWQQSITGLPLTGRMFAPGNPAIHEIVNNIVDVGYRDSEDEFGLSIPLVTLFDEKTDAGISFVSHIEMPIAPFRFVVSAASGKAELSPYDNETCASRVGVVTAIYCCP